MGFRDLIPVQQDFYKTLGILTLQKASSDRQARQLANQAFIENFRRKEADRSRKRAEKTERQQVNTMIGGTILATLVGGAAGSAVGGASKAGSAASAITAAEAGAAAGTATGAATGAAGSGIGAGVAGATGSTAAAGGGLLSGIGSALNKGGRTVLGAAEDQTLSGRALELLPQALAQMTDARAGTNLGGFVQGYQNRPRELAEIRSRNNREQIGLELAQNRDARDQSVFDANAAAQVRRAGIAETLVPGDADFAERYPLDPEAAMRGVVKAETARQKANTLSAVMKDHAANNVEANIVKLTDPAASKKMSLSYSIIETMEVEPETKQMLHLEQGLAESAGPSENYGTVNTNGEIATKHKGEKYVKDYMKLVTAEKISEASARGELGVIIKHLKATASALTEEEILMVLSNEIIDTSGSFMKLLRGAGRGIKGIPGAINAMPRGKGGLIFEGLPSDPFATDPNTRLTLNP